MRAARVDVEERVANAGAAAATAIGVPNDQGVQTMGGWISKYIPQVCFAEFHFSLCLSLSLALRLRPTRQRWLSPYLLPPLSFPKVAQLYGFAMIGVCINVSRLQKMSSPIESISRSFSSPNFSPRRLSSRPTRDCPGPGGGRSQRPRDSRPPASQDRILATHTNSPAISTTERQCERRDGITAGIRKPILCKRNGTSRVVS